MSDKKCVCCENTFPDEELTPIEYADGTIRYICNECVKALEEDRYEDEN